MGLSPSRGNIAASSYVCLRRSEYAHHTIPMKAMNASTVKMERRSLMSKCLPCLLEREAHALEVSDQCVELGHALDGLFRAGDFGIRVWHADRP